MEPIFFNDTWLARDIGVKTCFGSGMICSHHRIDGLFVGMSHLVRIRMGRHHIGGRRLILDEPSISDGIDARR